MKFAKQLQSDRVPEWIDYYLDYKLGKKKIKQYEAAKRRGVIAPSSDIDAFFKSELRKVESFYNQKEQVAVDRILELKLQFNVYQEQLFLRSSRPQEATAHYSEDFVRPLPTRRDARKKLKQALADFYRGLDLLKAYVALNSTAFRKLNKKFDKALNQTDAPLLRYYSHDVQQSHFFTSTTLDQVTVEVEDLFARHFAQGSRKAAVDELKARSLPDWHSLSWAMFYNGLFFGLGAPLALIGLIDAFEESGSSEMITTENSFLLQLYGGYFLMLLLMILFCGTCFLFDKKRINYEFIFQLNTYHNLDWRELLVVRITSTRLCYH